MIIEHDAAGYEYLGRLIYHNGFVGFLKTGPNREPLYPLLTAMSMFLGGKISISYQAIQMFLQMFILFLTQQLMLKILRKLYISNLLSALAILYIGISPAIINSVFRLYSEIVTYPLMLAIVYLSFKSWQGIQNAQRDKIFRNACLLGITFFLITMVKGIFEAIAPIFLFIFFVYVAQSLKKNQKSFKPAVIFFLISSLTFIAPVTLYKYANKKLNGNFVLTDRGGYALYGNTARRVEKLSSRQILTALSFAVSWRFCNARFSADECGFWSFTQSDAIGMGKSQELSQTMSAQEANKTLIKLSLQKFFEKPPQYFLLMAIESLKMLFWETPSMQYVFYPQPVIDVYTFKPLNRALYVVMPSLTFLSLAFTGFFLYCNRKKSLLHEETFPVLITLSILTASYIFMYSFFLILDRYSFPLVPLYLILIAFSFQQIFSPARARPSS